jgi:hypothetical protein
LLKHPYIWLFEINDHGGRTKEMKRKTTVIAYRLLQRCRSWRERWPPKGSKAEAHMSDKGRASTNAQWSADPKKGWVRAEERQQLRDDKNSKQNQVNRKGNGSKKYH